MTSYRSTVWGAVLFWPAMLTGVLLVAGSYRAVQVFWVYNWEAVIWPAMSGLFWLAGAVAAGILCLALVYIPFLYWWRRGAE